VDAFALLQGSVAHKALLAGSRAVQVDASHTSQTCPCCGYTSADNHPDKGLLLACQECHPTLHADLVGVCNVAMRTLLAWHDRGAVSTGVLSERPDVSNKEAKAAQRRRYGRAAVKSRRKPPAAARGS
jgi:putative transposase